MTSLNPFSLDIETLDPDQFEPRQSRFTYGRKSRFNRKNPEIQITVGSLEEWYEERVKFAPKRPKLEENAPHQAGERVVLNPSPVLQEPLKVKETKKNPKKRSREEITSSSPSPTYSSIDEEELERKERKSNKKAILQLLVEKEEPLPIKIIKETLQLSHKECQESLEEMISEKNAVKKDIGRGQLLFMASFKFSLLDYETSEEFEKENSPRNNQSYKKKNQPSKKQSGVQQGLSQADIDLLLKLTSECEAFEEEELQRDSQIQEIDQTIKKLKQVETADQLNSKIQNERKAEKELKTEVRSLLHENELHKEGLEEAKFEYFKLQMLTQEVERRRDCCFDVVELLADGMQSNKAQVLTLVGLDLNDLTQNEGLSLLQIEQRQFEKANDDDCEEEEEDQQERRPRKSMREEAGESSSEGEEEEEYDQREEIEKLEGARRRSRK